MIEEDTVHSTISLKRLPILIVVNPTEGRSMVASVIANNRIISLLIILVISTSIRAAEKSGVALVP